MASPGEVATAVSITTLAASHLFLGTLGFATFRAQLPASIYFSLACIGMAWTTFWTGIRSLVVDAHPWVLAIAPALSTFAAPAFMLFVWHAVSPRRPPSPRWLLMGIPGVLFSAIGLSSDDAQRFLVNFARHEGPAWHPWVSPFYLGHGVQMLGSVLWTCALLVSGLRRAPAGRARSSLWWLVAAIACAGVSVFVYTWLPGFFGSDAALLWAPWTTLPFVALSWRALRLQWIEARSAYVLRNEAERQRATSVAHAVHALAAEVGRVVARAESEATLLGRGDAPVGPDKDRVDRISDRIRDAVEVTQRLMRLSTAAAQPLTPVDISGAILKAARAAERGGALRVRTTLAGEARGVVAFAEPDAIAAGLSALLLEVTRRLGVQTFEVRAEVHRPGIVPAEALGEPLDGVDTATVRVIVPLTRATAPRAASVLNELTEGWSGRPGGATRSAAAELRASGATFHGVCTPESLTLMLWLRAAPPAPVDLVPGVLERVPLDPGEPRALLVGADSSVTEPVRLMLSARGVDARTLPTAAEAWTWVARATADTRWACLFVLAQGDAEALAMVYRVRRACPAARILALADSATQARLARNVDGLPIEVVEREAPLNEVVAWLTRALA